MTNKKYFWTIASFLSVLIISLPITLAQEINYVTDANGNLVTGDSFYREYNELNQLIRVRQGNTSNGQILEEYEWHPVEERILIKDVFSNGVKNYTVYYVNKEYIVIENSTGNYTEEYIYQDGVLVAQVNADGQKQAVHSDHEGSNTLITDSSGNVVENTFFSPYGEILEGGKSSRYGYEAKEYDSLVDDIDFKFRKYNPKIPILHQPDDRIPNLYDSQSLNRYMFERGNPYKYVDEDGHASVVVNILVAIFIGFAIAAHVLESYTDYQKNLKQAGYTQEPKQQTPPPYSDLKSGYYQGESSSINNIKSNLENSVVKSYDHAKVEVNIESLDIADFTYTIGKDQTDPDKGNKDKEQTVTCPKCIKKLQVDEKGNLLIVTLNEKGQEVSRTSAGSPGGRGGSDFIPDPSGRKDRFANPVYVPNPEPPPKPKPCCKPVGK